MYRGFSLIELSIVLVILGLLIGGILAGQSLIRAAELRSIANDFQRYQTATKIFRQKYLGLPGDINNATSFWGTAGACPGDSTTPSTSSDTCNGNANGQVEYFWNPGAVEAPETHRYWQHLANAGLIEGSYTGVKAGADTRTYAPGLNAPNGRLSNSVWVMNSYGQRNNDFWWAGNYDNQMSLMGVGVDATLGTGRAIIKPEEMWGIDVKIDDGKPQHGMLRSMRTADTNCSTSTDAAIAEYNLTHNGVACRLLFVGW